MDFIKPYARLIESELKKLDLPPAPKTLYDPQRYILSSGGKRIRPVLTLMSCGLCGGETERALPAAMAVELAHNFTLIHDDIMDQAESRRNKPSVHIKWNKPVAILAGDGIFVQAMLQFEKLSSDIDYRRICGLFLKGVNQVCEGQALDMEFENRFDLRTEDYLGMISGKTGALLSAAMQMGGVTAKADNEEIEQLKMIGESLGMAFQVQDDYLDVAADPEKFGKKARGDIFEGKKTFLMLKALERCDKSEKKWLTEQLINRPMDSSGVSDVIELYKKYRVEEEAKTVISSYYGKALETLKEFGDSVYKRDLQQLITYLQNRES